MKNKTNSLIIEAQPCNYNQLAYFLTQTLRFHRHLDWFETLEWLGSQPFLLQMDSDRIQAFLCATKEMNDTAWVRSFAVRKCLSSEKSWSFLFNSALLKLKELNVTNLSALAMHPWFKELLINSNFQNLQNIVVLEWQGVLPQQEKSNPEVEIHLMTADDLSGVEAIDHLAFPSLWRNSQRELRKAFQQKGISTVATKDNQIIGYQISTGMSIYAHLARLAVAPRYQRQGVAYTIIFDLLTRIISQGYWRLTVNTQSDNTPSLKLYDQFNFKRTGEEIPVYQLKI